LSTGNAPVAAHQACRAIIAPMERSAFEQISIGCGFSENDAVVSPRYAPGLILAVIIF
jgi:hypothetical protein